MGEEECAECVEGFGEERHCCCKGAVAGDVLVVGASGDAFDVGSRVVAKRIVIYQNHVGEAHDNLSVYETLAMCDPEDPQCIAYPSRLQTVILVYRV